MLVTTWKTAGQVRVPGHRATQVQPIDPAR
jgi:hypothetical protein